MRRLLMFAVAAGLSSGASAMPVSTFLAKAESLRKKGPLALMSSDLKLLMNQVKADSGALRSERLAAKQAGRPQAFCPPEGGVKLNDKDILTAMQAVPPAQRAATSTQAALRAYMGRRFPCRV
jgi:hypothetical protein